MKNNVYISLKEKVKINNSTVKMIDISDIYCDDDNVAKEIEKLEILHFNKVPNRAIVSITDILRIIDDNIRGVEVVNYHNTNVIVEYAKEKKKMSPFFEFIKIVFVCMVVFFGAAFAIMSFNEDVSTRNLFGNVYELFTGKESNGKTIIEACYSFGLGLGIVVLYGHFWKLKLTNDPTPIEVEMNKYEKDIDATIISKADKGD